MLAEGHDDAGAQAVFLIDVLNHLGALNGHKVEGDDLWVLP